MTRSQPIPGVVLACACTLLLMAVLPAATHGQAGDSRPVIRTQAELPRHTYEIPTATASALLGDTAFAGFAARVRADVEALLAGYHIEDRATLRTLHGTLETLAVLRGDYDTALEHVAAARALQDKPAERLMAGRLSEAMIAAERQGGDVGARREAFRARYAAAVGELPWDVVRDAVKGLKGQLEIYSANLLVGLAQTQYDPAAAETRRVSGDVARDLIGMRGLMDVTLAYRQPAIDVLQAYIDEHDVAKPDIWAERDVDLSGTEGLAPVVIGIWDTGVDAAVFGPQAFRNPRETLNGRDDDGNGFVDDVHGIAWNLWSQDAVSSLLVPLDAASAARLPQMREQLKGLLDIQANIDSREAQQLRQHLATLQPEDVQPFLEELGLFAVYTHGTHVAGIATAGNPAARVLTVRETFPHQVIQPPILLEEAARWADNMQRTVDYLRQQGARVVNMSWGTTAAGIESTYEMNGIGGTAEERRLQAQAAFDVLMQGMTRAMASAPEILFVPAAGNSDEDIGFTIDMPASIDLPNVFSVGAVDQAGEETSFTSYGALVRAHANGFEVDSYVPGGERMAFSGTSMAAPNVANLAAKLLAVDPSLTTADVVRLILDGAARSDDGRRLLINPRRSMELLQASRRAADAAA